MSKKVGYIIVDNDNDFKQVMKQSEEFGIERGLIATLPNDIHGELTKMFNALKTKGYHVTGFILDDNKQIEFLYHKDPKIKENLRVVEPNDKYKM